MYQILLHLNKCFMKIDLDSTLFRSLSRMREYTT